MWQTTLFSNGTTLRYQANSISSAPQYYCFSSSDTISLDSYYCTTIRMSMISWISEQSRPGFLTLIGIIGGVISILYHLSFWFLLLLRRIHTRFFQQPSQSLIQAEIV